MDHRGDTKGGLFAVCNYCVGVWNKVSSNRERRLLPTKLAICINQLVRPLTTTVRWLTTLDSFPNESMTIFG